MKLLTSGVLSPGELVKDEHFTLFEAVGALEVLTDVKLYGMSLMKLQIGDPKMDSGCLEEGEDPDDDFDFSRPLSEQQLVWLMDELTCREVPMLPLSDC